MGLVERRATKEFEDKKFKELNDSINKIAGKELTIEVDWSSIALDDMNHLYEEAWTMVYFKPLQIALENICIDDMGKEAILESLDKVIIQNKRNEHLVDQWAVLENKTLTLDIKPFSNTHKVDERADNLRKTLEDSL